MMHLGLGSVSGDGADSQRAHGKWSEGRWRESKGDLRDHKTTDSTLRKWTEKTLNRKNNQKTPCVAVRQNKNQVLVSSVKKNMNDRPLTPDRPITAQAGTSSCSCQASDLIMD